MRVALLVWLSVVVGLPVLSGCRADELEYAGRALSAEALDAHVRFLASDVLEGRAPGTRGSELAALYIASQFALAGLEPAAEGSSYLQRVSLVATVPRPRLSFRARGGARLQPRYGPDYVAWSADPVDSTSVAGELLFVGYGISAPELEWDDYKGVDLSGKVLLILANDPGRWAGGRFRGDTLTYYGRWTYKLEEATRRGAAGAIIIHTPESVGYGWNVVRSSWSGEQVRLEPRPGADPLGFEGWLSRESAEQVLSMAGLDYETLWESARSPEFRPVATGVTVSAEVRSGVRRFTDANVAGLLRGSDPQRADQVVVFTSHYDHLGVGSAVDEDSIYNGAYDNASGSALLITLADAFARLRERPARSLLFLAVTAEESGLLGSRYYTENPLFPLSKTVANVNVDGANFWGRTQDVVVIGAEGSSLLETVAAAADAEGLRLKGDQAPEQGYLYRSDQFSFMKAGIPAAYIEHGLDYVGRMPGWGDNMREEYNAARYHQPSDEYDPQFDYSGAVQQARVVFRVGLSVANATDIPVWNEGSQFKAVRDSILASASALNGTQ